jgi:hypothetical protein
MLGSYVGGGEGAFVGKVGTFVGAAEGFAVGEDVGSADVGAGVGPHVLHPSMLF